MGVEKIIQAERRARVAAEAQRVDSKLNPRMQAVRQEAKVKGASSVLTALPLAKFGFVSPAKRDFHDLLCLRYDKTPPNLPATCGCG